MADHVHLWTSFEGGAAGTQPVRDCIVCGKLQTWDESFADREPGIWFNYATKTFDDTPFGSRSKRMEALGEQWDCEEHGHLLTMGSPECVVCGAVAEGLAGS